MVPFHFGYFGFIGGDAGGAGGGGEGVFLHSIIHVLPGQHARMTLHAGGLHLLAFSVSPCSETMSEVAGQSSRLCLTLNVLQVNMVFGGKFEGRENFKAIIKGVYQVCNGLTGVLLSHCPTRQ